MNWQFVLAEKWDLVFVRSNKQFGRKSDYCYLDSMGFVRVMPSSTLFSLQAPVTHSLNIITFENFAYPCFLAQMESNDATMINTNAHQKISVIQF